MKTLIRLLFVNIAALVTLLFAASCAEYGTPGTVNSGAKAYSSAPETNRLGGSTATGSDSYTSRAFERPGLAATMGYESRSPVTGGPFYRKPGGVPDATDSFHYNDETGAKAMMTALGDAHARGGLFPAAGDRLKVGLRSNGDDLSRLEAKGQRIVIGQGGQDFEIALKNISKHRLEIVASVDGLDVLDGKAASARKYGYVLEPGQEYSIEGFRKNQDQVKRFVFGSVNHSEAAKKGEARNVGVIGLAVYEEDEAAAHAAQLAEAFKRSGASAFPRN